MDTASDDEMIDTRNECGEKQGLIMVVVINLIESIKYIYPPHSPSEVTV